MTDDKDEIKDVRLQSSQVSRKEVKQRIKDCVQFLILNRTTLFITCIAGALTGFLYSHYKKTDYIATSSFVLEEKGASGMLGAYSGLASQLGLSLGSGAGSESLFQSDNIITLYKSRTMLKKTLLTSVPIGNRQQLLINRFIDVLNLRKKWGDDNPDLKNINFKDNDRLSILQDSIITVIVITLNKKYLSIVKPDKKSSIINVTVIFPDQLFAKYFDEDLVANVNQFYINAKIKKSSQNVTTLKFQSDSVRKLLNESIQGVASAIDASPNPNPFNQTLKVSSQKKQVDVQTNAALYAEFVKNMALAQITMRQETPLIQIIDGPVLPLEEEKVGPLKGIVLGMALFVLVVGFFLVMKKLLA